MTNPWTFQGEPPPSGLTGGSVTLVEGASFAISSMNGDIVPGGAHGLFFEDTRFVSAWQLTVDGTSLQSLATIAHHPFAATFVSRGHPSPGQSDSTLFVERSRYVGNGMREDLVLRNFGREAVACAVALELGSDFAHLFEVKENRVRARGTHAIEVGTSSLQFRYAYRDVTRGLEVAFPEGARVDADRAEIDVVVPAGGEWRACFEFHLVVDGEAIELRYGKDDPVERSTPVTRQRDWEHAAPRLRTALRSVDETFRRSEIDLGALRIFDPEQPDRAVIAAGAPWFMTLFGRDSLLTSLMTLAIDPSLATNTLFTLARLQGEHVDDLTEEQPGKILHEMRRGLTSEADARQGSIYFGSIDSTPLFVVLLGEVHRWGVEDEVVRQLLPHADRALAWIEQYGDRDGDGFVEYQRATARGLANQGWKDSFDGISYAEGRLAEAPIALCEVQGYVYRAYLARAELARHFAEPGVAEDYERRAQRLKAEFNERFWSSERGHFAIALDGDKCLVDSLGSNIGHCLWAGIVDDDKAEATAESLCSSEMFTGWGVRTLATSMARYNPVSYHNGSVWPHDSAICAAGLARYGYREQAGAITVGLFEAAEAFRGRLPELFCGFDRGAFPVPVGYPSSCSPQAWASAAPLWLLQTTLLGLAPDIPAGSVACAPNIPKSFGTVSVENLLLGASRVRIEATGGHATVSGLPEVLHQVDDLTTERA